jgi:hypothetical protein
MTTIGVDVRRARAVALIRDGTLTFAALVLSFAAFDDITTDKETDFALEHGAVLVCTGWLFVVTFWLIRASRGVLGAISFVLLVGTLWGQIGPGITPGLWPVYTLTASAFVWFMVVSVVLVVSGWRAHLSATRKGRSDACERRQDAGC